MPIPEPGDASFDWCNYEHTREFIHGLCARIDRDRIIAKNKVLKECLIQSRDQVYARANEMAAYIEKEQINSDRKVTQKDNYHAGCGASKASLANLDVETHAKILDSKKACDNVYMPQLPATRYCQGSQDCSSSIAKRQKQEIIFFKGKLKRAHGQQKIIPTIFNDVNSPDRPQAKSTVFLKKNYTAEDQRDLKFAVYFGENNADEEDAEILAELFDTEKRERLLDDGPEYLEDQRHNAIDWILEGMMDKIEEYLKSSMNPMTKYRSAQKKRYFGIQNIGTLILQLLDSISDVKKVEMAYLHHRYQTKFASRLVKLRQILGQENLFFSGIDMSLDGSNKSIALESSKTTEPNTTKVAKEIKCHNTSPGVVVSIPVKNSELESTAKDVQYGDVMDSYRNLFCRRCFLYDCNLHGNLQPPNIELQTALALKYEKEEEESLQLQDLGLPLVQPKSNSSLVCVDCDDFIKPSSDLGLYLVQPKSNSSLLCVDCDDSVKPSSDNDKTKDSRGSNAIDLTKSSGKLSQSLKDVSSEKTSTSNDSNWKLTTLQRAISRHSYQTFQGEAKQISIALGADVEEIQKHAKQQNHHDTMIPEMYCQVIDKSVDSKQRKKGKRNYETSMKSYNPKWVKRIEAAEIHPAFEPCDHDEPCSDETCSCVKNAFFCTKHCAWGKESRNFFRGCSCKRGQCQAKHCPCFGAGRECDPDLCRDCGACSDPPNQFASAQNCRNDNIAMRRHCHLLVAESQVKEAGWGLYSKTALKKGAFIHEYVGEVISQEEADRRGCIYDKVNRSYLFNLTSDTVVDASRKGNKTKFLNHSSTPNCSTKMVMVNGDYRIGIFAREDIDQQTELFFDYRYDVGISNDLIEKPAMKVKWMGKQKKMKKIKKKASKKYA
uniref:Uncharacterized protein n=1 Tax=Chaetoceros debilis TaxID=122233 RepID=A0A7S3V6Z6_9STRA|mmetsp:Transcript_6652/g.9754  ORF Transcript_6652/g.9754 Transcript_6652/m.9754 type:complete len:888 (+) Transcript_6652:65-2728(+)|eukprot:CAMPEP_0194106530 /NCGR_PEP_ID=MMETSP0150-20130528/6516_1 /TAXON_ID=122233 /ORGANISM="Chaetoceros debilis, Strain MM31A-1" /LENGTH=887 /DNA_ID=CAMNT_0038794683 /DNA_START=79 /DNA_END=2742 /DNA_ORIENTATION=-